MTDSDEKARQILQALLDQGRTTVSIQKEYGFNRGLIPYVLRGNHSPTVLKALGLPILEKKEVPVCEWCGEIHTLHKMCSEDKRVQVRFRKSADMESSRCFVRIRTSAGTATPIVSPMLTSSTPISMRRDATDVVDFGSILPA